MELQRLGQQIRTRRVARGWSLRNLEKLCGVDSSHLSRIESGKGNPRLGTFLNVCEALRCEFKLGNSADVTIRLPTTSLLMEQILSALEPPRSDRTFARLFGAAVALIADWELIVRNPPPRSRISQQTWDYHDLLPDLRRSLQECGSVDWESSPSLISWSIGLFRNLAREHIALVLNRCVYWWLVTKVPAAKERCQTYDFTKRVEELGKAITNFSSSTHAKKMVVELQRCYAKYKDIGFTINHMQQLTVDSKLYLEINSLEELIEYDQLPTGAECASIVFTLNDASAYVDEEYGWAYGLEWAITTKALFWVGEFRRTMLSNVPHTKTP